MDERAAEARAAADWCVAPGVWLLPDFVETGVVHGIGDRTLTLEILLEHLGLAGRPVVRLQQVHGEAILEVAQPPAPGQVWDGYDGAITDQRGVVLTIRTADCAALGFYDPAHHAIGVAHAGWRGLASGLPARVVEAMVRRWGTHPADVRVGIGPMIGPCCYEVGPEFAPRFPAWIRSQGDRRMLDLRAGIHAQLAQAGIVPERIFDSGVCTACHVEQFFSYRREGAAAGRCHFALALGADRS